MTIEACYTKEMFDLLGEFANRPYSAGDKDTEQGKVLSLAWDILISQAKTIQNKCFPSGVCEFTKNIAFPSKATKFRDYYWVKIYPHKESNKKLAYTLTMNPRGISLRVDTIKAQGELRAEYENIRGDEYSSPLVKTLEADNVVIKTSDEIISWLEEQIDFLKLQYEHLLHSLPLKEDKLKRMKQKKDSQILITPLNQILYGPPGTGKTYHTIEAAVKAAEPDFYCSLDIDANHVATSEQRAQLKKRYEELVREGRIRFVTFHQSYGYEEFVEGLKASSGEDRSIHYSVESGVFRQISENAQQSADTKIVKKVEVFDECWDVLLNELEKSEDGIRINTKRKFFTLTSVDSSTIRFEKSGGDSVHTLNVETLKSIFDGERILTGGLNPYYTGLVEYLKSTIDSTSKLDIKRKNYVLVIDEINRGNISKIFGELITLIEPSKRKGETESIELKLPYSGKLFSVPNNLYIIGTMNTADRSLAMMDTALRRRFDFVEMMPKPELLNENVEGINIQTLLLTLNHRIEILYDREHTLGHAFLIDVKSLEDLANVFKNKVIPLLQEYFFDDWEKIRLILGDNQKTNNDLVFINKIEKDNTELKTLFGDGFSIEQYESFVNYQVNTNAFDNSDAYVEIYQKEKILDSANMPELKEHGN